MSRLEIITDTQESQKSMETVKGELVMYTEALRNTRLTLPAVVYRKRKIKQNNEMSEIIELDNSGQPINTSEYLCSIDTFTGKPVMVKLLAVA